MYGNLTTNKGDYVNIIFNIIGILCLMFGIFMGIVSVETYGMVAIKDIVWFPLPSPHALPLVAVALGILCIIASWMPMPRIAVEPIRRIPLDRIPRIIPERKGNR
jgi:hypothetical protein